MSYFLIQIWSISLHDVENDIIVASGKWHHYFKFKVIVGDHEIIQTFWVFFHLKRKVYLVTWYSLLFLLSEF